jgi:hypothetical protein
VRSARLDLDPRSHEALAGSRCCRWKFARKSPPRPFSKTGVEIAVFHCPQTQCWRGRYFVPASICLMEQLGRFPQPMRQLQ